MAKFLRVILNRDAKYNSVLNYGMKFWKQEMRSMERISAQCCWIPYNQTARHYSTDIIVES